MKEGSQGETLADTRVDDTPPPSVRGARASIVQILGHELGKRYVVDDELTIGRARDNRVVIEMGGVSRQHARIYRRGEVTFIEDLQSANGTKVNDTRITTERHLRHGDLVQVGDIVFRYVSGTEAEARFHDEIYRLAITDPVTDLPNRRYLDDFLEREVARSTRSAGPLSLVLVDVDHFKKVNDEHGHQYGDRVLRELADRIQRLIRRESLFARFGGDEFAMVLPEVDVHGAVVFAERVRHRVEKARFGQAEPPLAVTISAGAASFESGRSVAELLARTDRSLYEAKKRGRNRVVSLEREDL